MSGASFLDKVAIQNQSDPRTLVAMKWLAQTGPISRYGDVQALVFVD